MDTIHFSDNHYKVQNCSDLLEYKIPFQLSLYDKSYSKAWSSLEFIGTLELYHDEMGYLWSSKFCGTSIAHQ